MAPDTNVKEWMPALAASTSAAPDATLSVPIEGMTCASCVRRVERAIAAYNSPGYQAALKALGDSAVRDNFRFGMVAYRADISARPQLEYVTRLVAAPDLSQPPAAILPALESVRAATVSSSHAEKVRPDSMDQSRSTAAELREAGKHLG